MRAHARSARSYRIRERSDELWTEIKYVLDIFAQPLTTLFKSTLQLLSVRCQGSEGERKEKVLSRGSRHVYLPRKTTTDANALRVIFNSIELMCDIFYSLNYQVCAAVFKSGRQHRLTCSVFLRICRHFSKTTLRSGWTTLHCCWRCLTIRHWPTT